MVQGVLHKQTLHIHEAGMLLKIASGLCLLVSVLTTGPTKQWK